MQLPDPPPSKRSLWQTAVFLGSMIALLVFADWANPSMSETWGSSKSILPLLFGGVFVTGFVSALIPEQLVAGWAGGNSLLQK
jgi:hypothetical protein